jgi:molybdate transport system regulatory protein
MSELIVRIDLGSCGRMGPGKLELLQKIDRYGSISAASRAMGINFRQAWTLIDQLNHAFKEPVVVANHGGHRGGGAVVTDFGKKIVEHYTAIITDARIKASPHLAFIDSCLRSSSAADGASPHGSVARRDRKARRVQRSPAEPAR